MKGTGPVMPVTWKAEISRIAVQANPEQIVHETLSRKHQHQVVECLPAYQAEALSSDPSTIKKKDKKLWENKPTLHQDLVLR
jgi:hypothetical protein